MRGIFISLEGIEGCGKSTQARLLSKRLRAQGQRVLVTAEPGSTSLGRGIRSCLLGTGRRVIPIAEWLLFEADRSQHVRDVIEPALRRGLTVICDRYSDSTRAYQGLARGLGLGLVNRVDRLATGGLKPNITFVLDVPVSEGLARARRRGHLTRLDREKTRFHEKVRSAYLVLATRDPGRIKVIDGRLGPFEVGDAIFRHVSRLLPRGA